jgi:hypothetical protein
MEYYAKKYGVPVKLARALIGQESGGRNSATSPKNAVGQMQIHLPSHPHVTERQARDPDFAWDYGFKLLSGHKKTFGSWRLALAAYNAGPGAVKSGDWTSYGETTTYVRNILAKAGALPKTTATKPGKAPGMQKIPGVPQMPSLDVLGASSSSGLAALMGGRYDPTAQLGELQQLEAQPEAEEGVPPQEEITGGGNKPAGDIDWRDWVAVPPARGSTSKPHQAPILQFVGQIGSMAGRKLSVWDNTTHSRTTVNGNESAHYGGNAADIPATGKELRELGYLALRAAGMSEKRARAAQRRGGLYNVGGYQIIFATNTGGNHHDHLHVGIRG